MTGNQKDRFKLPRRKGHGRNSKETYKNASSSLSQIHRKLGYKTTHKQFMKNNQRNAVRERLMGRRGRTLITWE